MDYRRDQQPAIYAAYPSPGRQRVRFLFMYEEELRAIAWMNVGRDGSLLYNASVAKGGPTIVKHGSVQSDANGTATIEYSAGCLVEDQALRDSHITYHASGLVKSGNVRTWSVSLRELEGTQQLFQAVFRHPRTCPTVHEPRRWDATPLALGSSLGALVPYKLTDDRPLVGIVLAAPTGRLELPDWGSALIMPFTDLRECQDLELAFIFDTQVGAWAPHSYVVWASR